MDEDEEVVRIFCGHKGFISAAIEEIFGMRDVGGVGDLESEDRERRMGRPQAAKAHEHFFTAHDTAQECFDFVESGLSVERCGIESELDGF